ncbi:MAG: glutamate--tRNA ligase [Chitinophagaceae bacterium]|nr:glutamate--tRNA ligase [Chitinophagaceae bacterium]
MSVRVRFAPSPTGPLHIGGVRTALYNYLFAKQHNGTFIIRVEDTDQNRLVNGAEEYMLQGLEWCGIVADEGPGSGGPYGPYKQSERKQLYYPFALQLVTAGNAYYAFDTAEELNTMRERLKSSGSSSLQYDSLTRDAMSNSLTLPADEVKLRIDRGDHYVIRAKIPADEEIKFTDLIRGEVLVNSSQLDDKVLFKSDGMPTYHLANVVDDHLMKITHVIRGEEWLPSAPLHYLLYRFFGWEEERPKFAHLPLILRPDGNGKLSKRDGDRLGFPVFPLNWKDPATGEQSLGFRERGFFPEAFANMLALIGWAPSESKEVLPMSALIKDFNIERIHKAGAKFDFEKAKWFNHEYMKQKSGNELSAFIKLELMEIGREASQDYIERVCEVIKLRCTFINELWQNAAVFFIAPVEFDTTVVKSKWNNQAGKNFEMLASELQAHDDFSMHSADTFLHDFLNQHNFKAGDILPVLRVMLIGTKNGPAVFEIVSLLGKEETLNRMKVAAVKFDGMTAT